MTIHRGRLEQLAAAVAPRNDLGEADPNMGRVVPMSTLPAAGGLVTLADTQLITARVPAPRQWLVTIMQTQRLQQPLAPWLQNFDGTPYDNTTAQFGAPVTPQQGGVNLSMLQVRVQWGMGGARWSTRFDYPLMGGVFGLTADAVNIDVKLRSDAAQTAIPANVAPVVGAFMVPGQAADPTPLRWLEPTVNIAQGSGATWSVKPFTRKVRITSVTCGKLTGAFEIVTGAANNLQVIKQFSVTEPVANAGIDVLLDVPAQCEALGITNTASQLGNPANFTVEWYMGLV